MTLNEWLHIRASKKDKDRLEVIKEHEGLDNSSATVRKLIDDKYREIVGKFKGGKNESNTG